MAHERRLDDVKELRILLDEAVGLVGQGMELHNVAQHARKFTPGDLDSGGQAMEAQEAFTAQVVRSFTMHMRIALRPRQ